MYKPNTLQQYAQSLCSILQHRGLRLTPRGVIPNAEISGSQAEEADSDVLEGAESSVRVNSSSTLRTICHSDTAFRSVPAEVENMHCRSDDRLFTTSKPTKLTVVGVVITVVPAYIPSFLCYYLVDARSTCGMQELCVSLQHIVL